MRRVPLALALTALLPVAARAEPVSIGVHSAEGGFTQSGTDIGGLSINLGSITMPTVGSSGILAVSGLEVWQNYDVTFQLTLGSFDTLRVEILDPLDQDDGLDQSNNQPAYVPAGFSTSHNVDGFSFAQSAGLQRSAVFAGGSASVTADEMSNRGDVLLFSGLSGVNTALVRFGLRDSDGLRGFLVHFSALGPDSLTTPEPASMVLLGSGLVGLVGMYRRRMRREARHTPEGC